MKNYTQNDIMQMECIVSDYYKNKRKNTLKQVKTVLCNIFTLQRILGLILAVLPIIIPVLFKELSELFSIVPFTFVVGIGMIFSRENVLTLHSN